MEAQGDAAHEDELLRCACLGCKSLDTPSRCRRLIGHRQQRNDTVPLRRHLVEIEDDLKDYRRTKKGAFNTTPSRGGRRATRHSPAGLDREREVYIETRAVLTDEQLKFHVAERVAGRRGTGDGSGGLQWGVGVADADRPADDEPSIG